MDFRVRPRDMAIRIDFRGWPRLYGIDNAPGPFDVAEDALHMVVLPHQYVTDASA